jgi:hypothetical protein
MSRDRHPLTPKLKSGDYDGTTIMQAWCALDQQQARIKELEDRLRWRKWPDEKPEADQKVLVDYNGKLQVSTYPAEGGKLNIPACPRWLPIPEVE